MGVSYLFGRNFSTVLIYSTIMTSKAYRFLNSLLLLMVMYTELGLQSNYAPTSIVFCILDSIM